jgi:hypothetical protein
MPILEIDPCEACGGRDHLNAVSKAVTLVGIAVTVEENPVQKDTEFMSRDLNAVNFPAKFSMLV